MRLVINNNFFDVWDNTLCFCFISEIRLIHVDSVLKIYDFKPIIETSEGTVYLSSKGKNEYTVGKDYYHFRENRKYIGCWLRLERGRFNLAAIHRLLGLSTHLANKKTLRQKSMEILRVIYGNL